MRRARGCAAVMTTMPAKALSAAAALTRARSFAGGQDRCAWAFVAIVVLLLGASAALTIGGSQATSPGHAMPTPADPAMSMAGSPGAASPAEFVAFVWMWTVMMVAMMLPSLAPQLWRYRQGLAARGAARPWRLAACAALAYFAVWSLCGGVVFAALAIVASLSAHHPGLERVMPVVGGATISIAGLLQFSSWKKRHLACCRGSAWASAAVSLKSPAAWRHGLRLGLHCNCCCAGMTAVLLALGIMDLRVMAVVGAAVTIERLSPARAPVVHTLGILLLGAGLLHTARTLAAGAF